MNLNLTFTAPVRFSIPERLALQKRKKKKKVKGRPSALPLQDHPSAWLPHKSFVAAGLCRQEKRGGLGMGGIWESHLCLWGDSF